MAIISLYKIDNSKIEKFKNYVHSHESGYVRKGDVQSVPYISDEDENATEIQYEVSLYYKPAQDERNLPWNWALRLFDEPDEKVKGSPSGFLLFQENQSTEMYVVTFGYAYFKVDQYCDKNWAFDFAKRSRFQNFKITALNSPASKLNKKINTYRDVYEDLDFESGDALTKLKGNISLESGFTLFKPTIEFGNSIKFSVDTLTLIHICRIIKYVESTIKNSEITQKIPYYNLIRDEEKKKNHLQKLRDLISTSSENLRELPIDFSEFQICGTNIIFNNDDEISYSYYRTSTTCNTISIDSLSTFVQENHILPEKLLDVWIVVKENGNEKYRKKILDIISYVDIGEHTLLIDGNWYEYNEDFLEYLKESISEIPVEYDPGLNYSKEIHKQYIESEFEIQKDLPENASLSEQDLHKILEQKYYTERYFNEAMKREHGYILEDRQLSTVVSHSSQQCPTKVEPMDLWKDETMYSVKFGKASSTFCYLVDQSLIAAKLIHKKQIYQERTVKKVCIWIVLDRAEELPNTGDGNPDLNSLNMFLFKCKLDNWKKEIRHMGFTPLVRVNYVKS
ncbi:MAG TPA: TIGR04141 family sporadically distributed protein [Methanocorpusculum sp.]|nr:TIGR04141 family sporadically distributed protein [Methanocorpusculum sp.]HJK42586.1 TIGR04141 family sporadically distributed protein [Methanocorpusculum sp.]